MDHRYFFFTSSSYMKGFIWLLRDSFDLSAYPDADVFILNLPDDEP